MWLRRYDLKNILKRFDFEKLKTWLTRKDMIQTLNLSQQKKDILEMLNQIINW